MVPSPVNLLSTTHSSPLALPDPPPTLPQMQQEVPYKFPPTELAQSNELSSSNTSQTNDLHSSQSSDLNVSQSSEGGNEGYVLPRSNSWTTDSLVNALNGNSGNLPGRRYSAHPSLGVANKPAPEGSTFWKQNGRVPGSIKVVTKTPPRSTAGQPPALTTTPTKPERPMSPPKEEPRPEELKSTLPRTGSPALTPQKPHPATEMSRSKSATYVATTHTNTSNGIGEYVHRCMQWKTCGRAGEISRLDRFRKILSEPVIDMETLKKNCWKGIPSEVRPQCWKLLLGYLPVNSDRRDAALQRKRQEYQENVTQYYRSHRTEDETSILKQILLDLPRTSSKYLFQQDIVQSILERILYVWAIRHPASEYVQGINDITTPFFVVFLNEYVDDVDSCDCTKLPQEHLNALEADTYWCLSKFLDGIQDFYTFAQPGIQRMTYRLQELVSRIDQPLTRHFQSNEFQYMNFSLRWMNCALVREFPLPLVARMYDTYLAEGEGFSTFHLYVCAAFLHRWSAELRLLDFQEMFLFLQRPPTNLWTCKDVELMLSQAFLWMETFQNAPAHLKNSTA